MDHRNLPAVDVPSRCHDGGHVRGVKLHVVEHVIRDIIVEDVGVDAAEERALFEIFLTSPLVAIKGLTKRWNV